MLHDIINRSDIKKLVAKFYENLLEQEAFNKIFLDLSRVDIIQQIEQMTAFWNSALFEPGTYKGDVINIHVDLHTKYPLRKEHFTAWITCFNDTVDNAFVGPNATGIKQRALTIANIIYKKISDLEKRRLELNN